MSKYLLVGVAFLLLAVAAAAQEDVDGDDFYGVLGLSDKGEDASDQDIKRQFRKLSKKYHPDHNPDARDTYVKVQRAYEVLSNRKKRKIYDMKGVEGLAQLEASEKNPNAGHHDPFMSMFGMGGGGNPSKGQDMKMRMGVQLEDVYNGATKSVTFKKQKLCKSCRGTGAASKADFTKCSACKGKGVTVQRIQIAPGFVQQAEAPCQKCGGTGKQIKRKCPVCHGQKVMQADQQLEIEIERGIPDEHRITFEMEANQSPDLIPGDVIIETFPKPHNVFRRLGNDLEMTMKITMKDALVGFSKSINHLDGHEVVVSRDEVTQYNTRVKIAGEGMPFHNVPSEKGDLYVILQFTMPHSLTSAQSEAIEKLL